MKIMPVYKATPSNLNTTKRGRRYGKEMMLGHMGRGSNAQVSLLTRIKRALGFRPTRRRKYYPTYYWTTKAFKFAILRPSCQSPLNVLPLLNFIQIFYSIITCHTIIILLILMSTSSSRQVFIPSTSHESLVSEPSSTPRDRPIIPSRIVPCKHDRTSYRYGCWALI